MRVHPGSRVWLILMFLALLAVPALCKPVSLDAPDALRCEQQTTSPLIDTTAPRLGWHLTWQGRGRRQTAYQVLVATSPEQLARDQGDLWRTGKIVSSRSQQVVYAGAPLSSGRECFWKVRAWDERGMSSAWSVPARWSMGLLKPAEWQGQWIGLNRLPSEQATDLHRPLPARYLRREFLITRPVLRATVYLCGLGLSELSINGRKVTDAVLSPALSQYEKRDYYVACDVTKMLSAGGNALGVVLGNGRFYAPRLRVPTSTVSGGLPRLLLQMNIAYRDGTTDHVVSDTQWKASDNGPIRVNNEYDGEVYDARMEMPGWDSPRFADTPWQPAEVVPAPGGTLSAQPMQPIRVVQTLRPVSVTSPAPGVYLFDLGQNIAGWCRLHVSGSAGTQITLRHAETLHDGRLYTANLRSATQTDVYTLKGGGPETYEPRFTTHGFRYVEMTGYPGTPTAQSLQGQVVRDDVASAGEFACSNPLVNRIYHNIVWGVADNYRSIPTDCPQRDERQGWLGDRSAESRGETYLFNIDNLYAKWVGDMEDAQRANGSIPDVAPSYWPLYNDSVTWPSSFILIPGMLYDQYGDASVLARHYPAMQRWISHMGGFVKNGLLPRDSYGDWCVPPASPLEIHTSDPAKKTDGTLLGTSYYYYCLTLMEQYATLLGKSADARQYRQQALPVKVAFNAKYLNASPGGYSNGTQTASILPLAFGMVPQGQRTPVFSHLTQKLQDETQGHVGTGLIGGQWLMRTLTDNGRPDLAYHIITQTTYPSWGYMVGQGATTVWELWNGNTANPAMNSGNHVMLVGDLVTWLYEDLAGIAPNPAKPGFQDCIMHPHPVGDLKFVTATHLTPYGAIRSAWRVNGAQFMWDVTIPPNASATVYVPVEKGSHEAVLHEPNVQYLRSTPDAIVYKIGSGQYHFTSKSLRK